MITTITLGYARVSTSGQNTDNQVERLKEAGCSEVFQEIESGTRNVRSSTFRSLFDRAKQLREEGHEVMILTTKIDRLSRTTLDFLASIRELAEMGVSYRALDGGISYIHGDATSKFIATIFAAIAELERELILSRTSEGTEVAKAKGVKFGAPPKFKQADVDRIRELYATGLYSAGQIARREGASRSTIHRVLGLYGSSPYVTREERDEANRKASKK